MIYVLLVLLGLIAISAQIDAWNANKKAYKLEEDLMEMKTKYLETHKELVKHTQYKDLDGFWPNRN